MKLLYKITTCFVVLFVSSAVFAQVNSGTQVNTGTAANKTDEVADLTAEVEELKEKVDGIQSRTNFGGIDWGVGVSLTGDIGSNARIKEASIVDGIVRVDDQDNSVARLMLESHYFFVPRGDIGAPSCFLGVTCNSGTGKNADINWGWGPFVAIQPGTDDVIDAVALGLMIGFKRSNDVADNASWNLGLGLVVDPNSQILGEGFEANKAPPGNETVVRYRQKQQVGWMLLFSATF